MDEPPEEADRDTFYDQRIAYFREHGEPSHSIEVIFLLMFNIDGELYIQRRALSKRHNAGLFDKTVGGHRIAGNTIDYTLLYEVLRELRTPCRLVAEEGFDQTLLLLRDFINVQALARVVDHPVVKLERVFNKERIAIASRAHLMFGIYNGPTDPAGKESRGVLRYSLEELEELVSRAPQDFTHDLKWILKNYRDQIVYFINRIHRITA